MDEVFHNGPRTREPYRKLRVYGQDGRQTREWFSQDAGAEGTRCAGGLAGADDDGREAQDAGVDEAAAGIIVQEDLGGEFLGAVASARARHGEFRYRLGGIWGVRSEDRAARGEDDYNTGVVDAEVIKDETHGVYIYLKAEREVLL